MADDPETPQNVIDEAMRRERRDFVRDINNALDGRDQLTFKEQGRILRGMADQLDKADERRALLNPSQERLAAKYRPTSFFTGQDRHRAYWEGRAKSPDYAAAARDVKARANGTDGITTRAEHWAAQMKAKAAELDPMRFFRRAQDPQQDQDPSQ